MLVSESEQRINILRNAGFEFEFVTSPYTEPPIPGVPATELAKMHALGKVISVIEQQDASQNYIYIGVDTIVLANNTEILLKPQDRADARRMLQLQQGSHVRVISGLAVIDPLLGREAVTAQSTLVHLDPLTDAEIDWYLDTKEWEGKSGGFAIQGLASRFFSSVEGDVLNVIGLPLNRLYNILRDWQIFQ